RGSVPLWLYVHVDDIAIFGKDVGSFKKEISEEFDIKDVGSADLMLGVKINHSKDFISLDQQHFTESLLELYGMSMCKTVSTPLPPHSHLGPPNNEEVTKFKQLNVNYRSAIGSINYLSTATRPDLSHAVSTLSQFLENPGIQHWNAFLHVLKYLNGTQEMGLVYTRNCSRGIRAYSDADWGNCPETRRSVTGFLVTFNNSLVIWKTRKQPTVSISTAEAEYKALCDLTSELVWFRQWCDECSLYQNSSPIPVHEDNQSCINTVEGHSNVNHKRMKHVDIQLHFIKEFAENSVIKLIYTPTNLMLADFLTKSVSRPTLSRSLDSLSVLRLGVKGGVENHNQDQSFNRADHCTSSRNLLKNNQYKRRPSLDNHLQSLFPQSNFLFPFVPLSFLSFLRILIFISLSTHFLLYYNSFILIRFRLFPEFTTDCILVISFGYLLSTFRILIDLQSRARLTKQWWISFLTMTESNAEISSIPILDGTNYGEWSAGITILLRSKDLLQVCENIVASDASTTVMNKWNKSSFEAVSIITSRVSNRVFIEVVKQNSANAHLLWTELQEKYASRKAINRGRVWMQWLRLTYNGNLQEYVDNNRKLMMAMETVNIAVPSELLSFTLLGKLSGDSKIHQYVETLLLNEELIELPDLILSKLQDFHNNSIVQEVTPTSSASALLSESTHPYKILYYCTNGKHNPMCTSHTKQECFVENPHLRPPRRNNKRRAQNNQNVSAHLSTAQALVTSDCPSTFSSDLIIDCGATHHMFNSKESFSTLGATPSFNVCTGDTTSSLSAKGIGTVTIACGEKIFTLSNCLYVPNLNCNLISLLGLGHKKISIHRDKEDFTLCSEDEILFKGKIENNLMKVNYSTPKTLITQSSNLWHLRLGHPGVQVIRSMGLPEMTSKCLTCDKNKMHLLPFKDQFEQFVLVKKAMENLHDQTLKRLVSDWGGEFLNHQFQRLSEECGFEHLMSPAETPQHNGFAERANCTILEKARCLLNGSNLPSTYWAEAVNTATLLSNLTPTPSRVNRSPYSLWKGSPPRIKKLRVFGCRAIIAIPKQHRKSKFSPSGAEGILLGYTNENTAYRILRLCDRKVIISRHVIFDESTFPSLKNRSSSFDSALLIPEYQEAVTEVVDETRSVNMGQVDEILPIEPILDEPSRMVDEIQDSSEIAASDQDRPACPSRIKVIGPRHPTLISSDVNSHNILPYSRRPKALLSIHDETPRTFKQAINSANKDVLNDAIKKELASMNRLSVWDVIDLKSDYKLVGTTWVFRTKRNHLNEVVDHKA
ncbi:hypothetical protein O181_074914, partial [Austropuccinia psidii MF-1]|nr:hypothetical protein [Austropuccinia psidii MF-1]